MLLESIGQAATEAMAAGTIEARSDSHLTENSLKLDKKGWNDLNKVLAEAVKKAGEIQKEAAKRLKEKEADPIATKLAVMHFEVPAAEKPKAKAKARK